MPLPTAKNPPVPPLDHQALARQQELFTFSAESPGSPLFLPHGAHVFNTLVSFLRAQHQRFGFQEVITPTIYKTSLWERSGHWDKYGNDMFEVKGRRESDPKASHQSSETGDDAHSYALKPMNCPGHCLLFRSKTRSYRDLPIRYADFSPLHRNELSGALSGLTRLRRFHQDDGHIFCMPSQVAQEISSTLEFVELVYRTFRLPPFKLVLSTRPKEHFIGAPQDWERAEAALKEALVNSRQNWSVAEGDGAFYGPKIDIILKDSNAKEHQTATLQLDFQLPQRFELAYQSATEQAAPVIIHRAIYGSLERFMALLIEHYNGRWPFWLSPRQAIVLTVNSSEHVIKYACEVAGIIAGQQPSGAPDSSISLPEPLHAPRFAVDVDDGAVRLQKKIASAKEKGYNVTIVVGPRNVERRTVEVDITNNTAGYDRARDILSDVMGASADAGTATPKAATARDSSHVIGDGRSVTMRPRDLYEYFCRLSHSYE